MIGKDINKYVELVSAFDRYKDNVKPSVYFLGLSGELGELCGVLSQVNAKVFDPDKETREKIISELGDVFWYWFALAKNLNLDYNKIWNDNINKKKEHTNNILQIVATVGRLTEHLKKSIRDDNNIITESRLTNIKEYMEKTLFYILSFYDEPYDVLQKNYDKLAARHTAGTLQGEGDGISGKDRKIK